MYDDDPNNNNPNLIDPVYLQMFAEGAASFALGGIASTLPGASELCMAFPLATGSFIYESVRKKNGLAGILTSAVVTAGYVAGSIIFDPTALTYIVNMLSQ